MEVANRENRGLILLALRDQFPHPLVDRNIERQVGPFYANDTREIEKDLAYLELKGLIERKQETIGGRRISSATLTAKGMDVCDKSVKDPGVEIAG